MNQHLVPGRRGRPADDPIFALNAEANARKAKGESIVNATLGALLDTQPPVQAQPIGQHDVKDVTALGLTARGRVDEQRRAGRHA